MRLPKDVRLFILLLLTGFSVWWIITVATGEAEAWDSLWYFIPGLPIMMLSSALAGYASPGRPWRWALAVVLPQPLFLLLQGTSGPLVFAGLLLFLVPFLLATGAAAFGGWQRIRKTA
ncbi:MAG: hypothetical protein MUF29_00370 [Chitinophagaceae bacterium]|jgi:hypothetical protein|nr:hypothetical protein [Chitinophagaceae bacterium]